MWHNLFPPAVWLQEYNKKKLKGDFVAGITLAAYGIPVSLAYATLAGLPPEYGIYGYLIGGFFMLFWEQASNWPLVPHRQYRYLLEPQLRIWLRATCKDGLILLHSPHWCLQLWQFLPIY